MSRKKQFVKKLLIEAIGKNNLDVLDEVLHPDYYAEKYVTDKDRFWNKITSNLLAFAYRSKAVETNINLDEGTVKQTGIEGARIRFDKNREDYLMPDFNVEIYYMIEEVNSVAAFYTLSFFHDRKYYNVNPTNQKIIWNNVHLFTFSENKITKIIYIADVYQLLSEIGDLVLNQGDEEQIQQYMTMLKDQNLIPRGMSD